MPTLFRFIVILAILGGIGYGAMWGLVTFVEPEPREMTSTISPMRFAPQR
ncbi:MAG: histidine kinase [Salinarimonadaceae bacterium]|nr:MAG: histidine kinase [Salinarimonadaceae bacterium]